MKHRYIVEMSTQDAEPAPVTRPLAYCDTLEEAMETLKEFEGGDYYVALFDRETDAYIS